MNLPVDTPDGTSITNVPIFAMLKQAMQAVSLARFFHDNNIPLDTWWLNSWQPPSATIPLSTPTIVNSNSNGTVSYLLFGGVQIHKPNVYLSSPNPGSPTSARSVGRTIQTVRQANASFSNGSLLQDLSVPQSWPVSITGQGTLSAVATC